MARQQRPGRTILLFLGFIALTFGLVAINGSWTPKLGLDLQGGTRITLVTDGDVTQESLNEAAAIIDQRVNGSGVSETEVTTQGNNIIVVEIPGETRRDLEETVKRQAQMRFRLVALAGSGVATDPNATPDPTDPSASPSVEPGTGVLAPSDEASVSPSPSDSPTAEPKNRPALGVAPSDSASPSADPSSSPEPSPAPTDTESTPADTGGTPPIDDPLKWAKNPDAESVAAYNAFSCPPNGEAPVVDDDPAKPLITCGTGDEEGQKFLLSVAMIEGSQLRSADSGLQETQYVVNLAFKGDAVDTFAEISKDLVGSDRRFAAVLDGVVISAPTMNGLITDGRAVISGNFTQASAQSLATSLKFGALPVRFNKDINVQTIGASLAGNQLQAGIWAGALGLFAVMLYCMIYYRGLGTVVVSSLFVAGALTYTMVMLLSEGAGFTLTLPGIAGLIVAVGITADSFIVLFERIRDEMRDGKSLRVGVESGWVRARNTCLAADTVSLLAAVVLFIFAAGVVKGFAFALGLSTVIDLVVFFWFTKPLVSYLARYPFFYRGHPMSGLSPDSLGISSINVGKKVAATGGTA